MNSRIYPPELMEKAIQDYINNDKRLKKRKLREAKLKRILYGSKSRN